MKCSKCQAEGVTMRTCPLNKKAKNKNYKLHKVAMKGGSSNSNKKVMSEQEAMAVLKRYYYSKAKHQ